MRITSQMLNNTRIKAGLPARGSLVNYLKNSSTSWNGQTTSSSLLNKLSKNNYQKLEKSSDELAEWAGQLAKKADSEDTDISSEAAGMVDKYNETLNNLKQASGTLNNYYLQSLKEAAAGNKDALAEIGITIASDGALTLNKEKLAGADGEKVRKLLGTSGDFVNKVSFVASRIADNAAANVESVSSQYGASGRASSSAYLNKYNFRA